MGNIFTARFIEFAKYFQAVFEEDLNIKISGLGMSV